MKMREIELYEKRNIGVKGEVVIPEALRDFMGVSAGAKIAFLTAVEETDNEYTVRIKVVR